MNIYKEEVLSDWSAEQGLARVVVVVVGGSKGSWLFKEQTLQPAFKFQPWGILTKELLL